MKGDNPQVDNKQQPDLVKRELERSSQDQIKVYNPTDKEWIEYWTGYGFRVPANGDGVMPRYVAKKYVKNMTDHLITKESEDKVDAENKRRTSSGQKLMDAQERELFDLKTNDESLRRKYIKQLWGGVDKEFGGDTPTTEATKRPDPRPLDEQLIDEVEDIPTVEPPVYVAKKDRKNTSKEALAKSLSA